MAIRTLNPVMIDGNKIAPQILIGTTFLTAANIVNLSGQNATFDNLQFLALSGNSINLDQQNVATISANNIYSSNFIGENGNLNYFQSIGLSAQTGQINNLTVVYFNIPTLSSNNVITSNIVTDTITLPPSGLVISGSLTILGTVSALSGYEVIGSFTTTTSSLSIVNTGFGPGFSVYQGPGYGPVAIFSGQNKDILTVNDPSITTLPNVVVNGVLSAGTHTSDNWNDVYTHVNILTSEWQYASVTLILSGNLTDLRTTVEENSASWGSSSDTLPTVTNYLSTDLVTISSLNVTEQVLSANTDLFNLFLTPNNTLTTSVCAMSGDGVTPFVMQFTNGLLTSVTT